MSKDNCQKELWNGCCCCNCANHLEDFYHCTTEPKPKGIDGCVCSTHKGWICRSQFEDSEEVGIIQDGVNMGCVKCTDLNRRNILIYVL